MMRIRDVWSWTQSFPEEMGFIINLKRQKSTFFERFPPWNTILTEFFAILTYHLKVFIVPFFWHSLWNVFLSYFDNLSGILSGIYSDIFSGMYSDSLPWHPFSHSTWRLFKHSVWRSFWHLIWHSLWHSFWHSIIPGILSGDQGPAVPTDLWPSHKLRPGSAQSDLKLTVEVWQCALRSGAGCKSGRGNGWDSLAVAIRGWKGEEGRKKEEEEGRRRRKKKEEGEEGRRRKKKEGEGRRRRQLW